MLQIYQNKNLSKSILEKSTSTHYACVTPTVLPGTTRDVCKTVGACTARTLTADVTKNEDEVHMVITEHGMKVISEEPVEK